MSTNAVIDEPRAKPEDKSTQNTDDKDGLRDTLKLTRTVTLKKEPVYDYSNEEKFKQSVVDTENEYQEERINELQRCSTSLHRLSRSITNRTGLSNKTDESDNKQKDLENQINEEEQDPEIVGYDPREIDWDSPDDPDNPYNWPSWKRWYCTMCASFLCLVITLGSSIYVAAIPEMMFKWKISQTLGLAGLTFYILGLAFGPTVAAPLSELFGRSVVYRISLPVSMLFIMGVGLSTRIRDVLVLRFFAGFTSSGALAIAGGTVMDIWRPEEIGIAMTSFCLSPLAGPIIGPVIGGFIGENKVSSDPHKIGGLRWTMWVNLFFAATVFIPLFLMPETYKPIILMSRLKKNGKKIKQSMSLSQFLIEVVFITLIKPGQMLVVEPIVLVFSIYTAFIFAVLFGFFEAYPVIFEGIYLWKLGVSGLPFLGVGVGLLLGSVAYLLMDKFIFFKKWEDGYVGMKDKDGNKIPPIPETRLLPCKVGSIGFAPSLFWLAWTSRTSVQWMAPIASGVLFGFSLVLIFFSILTYFTMAYPPMSVASAIAANNVTRYVVASVFPLFVVQMMHKLHVYWGVSIFAFIAVALAPVPWIFDRYGKQLRHHSKYGWYAIMKQKEEKEKEKEEKEKEVEEKIKNNLQSEENNLDDEENIVNGSNVNVKFLGEANKTSTSNMNISKEEEKSTSVSDAELSKEEDNKQLNI